MGRLSLGQSSDKLVLEAEDEAMELEEVGEADFVDLNHLRRQGLVEEVLPGFSDLSREEERIIGD